MPCWNSAESLNGFSVGFAIGAARTANVPNALDVATRRLACVAVLPAKNALDNPA